MNRQLHITHRGTYLRGWQQGQADAAAGRDYRPHEAATGTATEQQAYGLGYGDGYTTETEG